MKRTKSSISMNELKFQSVARGNRGKVRIWHDTHDLHEGRKQNGRLSLIFVRLRFVFRGYWLGHDRWSSLIWST